jgi:uncharacterized phiE125 gp8 family phage protein
MTYGLQVVTAPGSRPLSAAEVASYVKAYTGEDEHLESLIDQAVEEVARYTGRALISATYRLVQSDWPRGLPEFASYPRNTLGAYLHTLELPRCPVTAISSVKYYPADSEVLTTLSSSQYIAVTAYEPGMVYLKEGYEWPELSERPDAVQVEFTAGYANAASLPRTMRQALLLLCRYYYAGGSPDEQVGPADDLAKAHHILNNLKVSGWSA